MDQENIDEFIEKHGFELVDSYEGTVIETEYTREEFEKRKGGKAHVRFTKDGEQFTRVFPIERLHSIKASYEDAKIRYDIYTSDQCNLSVMTNLGESIDEIYDKLLKEPWPTISERDLRDLES